MKNSIAKNTKITQPLVSIYTPVYNGEEFLAECIESVMRQTYENWEYFIVDNCSKDASLDIAKAYAMQDVRIRVLKNDKFLPMIQNWNHSIPKISKHSKYCKIVHADDLLFPECLSKMVALAENNPSVGIVGSYVLEGVRVKCDGLPYPSPVNLGQDICRWSLMDSSPVQGGFYVFGSPTSLLFRTELIGNRRPFYNDRYLQVVDQEVCYHFLSKCDFGFVHDILTFSRIHNQSITSSVTPLNRLIIEELMLLVEYGPVYLDNHDYEMCLSKRMGNYYKFLASCFFESKSKDFWQFHADSLKRIGIQIKSSQLLYAVLKELVRRVLVNSAHPTRPLKWVFNSIKELSHKHQN